MSDSGLPPGAAAPDDLAYVFADLQADLEVALERVRCLAAQHPVPRPAPRQERMMQGVVVESRERPMLVIPEEAASRERAAALPPTEPRKDVTCQCGRGPLEITDHQDEAGVKFWWLANLCTECLEETSLRAAAPQQEENKTNG